MTSSKFSMAQRLKSFAYAFNGLKVLIQEEHNARIHLLATICAITLGYLLQLSVLEWIAVCFAIAGVIIAELINTAIENIANFISPQIDLRIKKIKDLTAAAVLVAAVLAIIVAGFIFLPKLYNIIANFKA